MAYCIHPKPIKTHPVSLSDKFCATILLLKRWSCGVWSVVIFCSSSFKICNRLQIVGWGRSCISQGAPANLSYFPTHYPPAHQSHPPQILPKHRPPQPLPKANQPKQAANALWNKSNGSFDIKEFGPLPLIFSTSKYFRWKFQPCPSFFCMQIFQINEKGVS